MLKAGTGAGAVTSAPAAVSCGATCGASLADGSVVVLTAAPSLGSRFAGWSGGGCSGTGTCTVAMTSAKLVTATFNVNFAISPAVLPGAVGGVAYVQALTAPSAAAPVTFALSAGALPSGVTLASDGVISGTPVVVGTFPVTVLATDLNGIKAFAGYSLGVVCPAITVNPAAVATPVINTLYAQAMSQSGGVGTATFAVTAGALPAGLSMSSAGAITGTPTAQGASSSFTITATDANGCTGSRAYASTVAGLPSVGLSLSTVNFGAVNNGAGTFTVQTPSQSVALTLNGPGTVTWTAVATQPWITVSPASGSGSGSITIAVNNAGGSLPTSGVLTGAVNITTTGASNSPSAAINLTILAGVSTRPEGLIDTPTEGLANVTGSLAVTGWAVDDIGVSAVRLCRMPIAGEGAAPDARCGGQPQIFIGDTVLVSGARPDIMTAFPLKPLNAQAGWGYLLLTNFLPAQGNGTVTLVVFAEDFDGHTTQLGTRAITCTNATATAPLGAIDTPAQGGTASGAAFVNFGWALAPQPRTIPTDGTTIQPYIDSIPVGTVTYNLARADIQALFPGYANTNGAVGFSIIDTTLLTNGVHTIAWVVTDNQGAASGIGSRYFTVLNSGSSLVAVPSAPAATAAAPAALVAGGGAATAAQRETPAPAVQALATILGARRELEGMETRRDAIEVTLGFGEGSPGLVKADPAGVHQVTLRGLGRLVLELDPAGDGAQHRGYEIQGDDLTALPVGSQFDPAAGRFTWAPGLGVGGTRHLVFVRSIGGREEVIRVDVTIDAAAVAR